MIETNEDRIRDMDVNELYDLLIHGLCQIIKMY